MRFGRWLLVGIALLSLPAVSVAQTAETYHIRYYAVGASEPLQQTDSFPASAVLCNQAPPASTNSVNPVRAIWDDPQNPGQVCTYAVPSNGALPSLPLGTYEATLVAANAAGSAESARAPFTRLGSPAAPQGLRFGR